MKLHFLTVLALACMMLSTAAFALDLHAARDAGLVGETLDGYVAALKETPDVQALVDEVNEKRRQEYARISAANGQPVAIVARLAAEQIINRLDTGAYYQDADGEWQVR